MEALALMSNTMSWKWPRRLLLVLLSMLITCSAWIPEVHLAAGSQPNDPGWTVASYSPSIGNYAVAVTGAGENIYIANSTTTPGVNYFMRYSTVENNWSYLSNPPQWFKNGTALAWDGGNYIYALLGASYSDISGGGRFYFYRYSISGNSWTKLADTPHTNGAGDALTFVPGWVLGVSDDNFLYATLGSKDPPGSQFHRYSIADNSWSAAISFIWDKTDDGSSLVWAGDNYLYALRGEYLETTPTRDFARFRLTDNTWNNLPDIPEEGGIGDGGSLVWVGGSYSDNIYALGGGYVGPNETPGENFYSYSISGNSWTKLPSLPYGITDQNGPRLGYANENIYCWRGYKNASQGDTNVLWAYAVPEINVRVSVSISPNENSDLPGENLTYTVTVTNVGALADSYDLTVSDNAGWPLTLSENLLENIGPGENKTVTLIVKIPENAPPDTKDNILVVAVSQTDNTVTCSNTCIAQALSPNAEFSLVPLYKVGLDTKLDLENGSKLVVKFYTYGDIFENENVFWSGTTPAHVEKNESVPHSGNIGVEKVRLDLTYDNTENVISTIASFIVRKVTLEMRFTEIPLKWALVPPEEKVKLETEFSKIPLYWALAPS